VRTGTDLVSPDKEIALQCREKANSRNRRRLIDEEGKKEEKRKEREKEKVNATKSVTESRDQQLLQYMQTRIDFYNGTRLFGGAGRGRLMSLAPLALQLTLGRCRSGT
jgi:hypothetical protein